MQPTEDEPVSPEYESHMHLDPWNEVIGQLEQIAVDGPRIGVTLSSGTLAYPLESREAEVLRERLVGKEGATVHILRCPDPAEPLRIRVTEEPE
jgi:hypothetical protein